MRRSQQKTKNAGLNRTGAFCLGWFTQKSTPVHHVVVMTMRMMCVGKVVHVILIPESKNISKDIFLILFLDVI